MKITCSLNIIEVDIENLIRPVNPENNPTEEKAAQVITFELKKPDEITYFFKNFEKITTLRLTLDDLLTHLSFSKEITHTIEKRKKN